MAARKGGRSSTTIDAELEDAQSRIKTLEQTTADLQKTVEERETTIKDLEQKLEATEKTAETAKTQASEKVEVLSKDLTALQQQHSELQSRVSESDQKYENMEQQLKIAKDDNSRMHTELETAQTEASRYAEETKILNAQLNEALGELTSTRDEVVKDREEKEHLEEGKSKAEQALEEMMAQMQEQDNKEGPTVSQLWITTAMAVCGTACVISLLFVKFYPKS